MAVLDRQTHLQCTNGSHDVHAAFAGFDEVGRTLLVCPPGTVFAICTDAIFSQCNVLASDHGLIPISDRQAHLQCTLWSTPLKNRAGWVYLGLLVESTL